jgi:hypothetical protein
LDAAQTILLAIIDILVIADDLVIAS